MKIKPELDELARRYLDLWERQLSARTGDADFEAQLQRWLALSSGQAQVPGGAVVEAMVEAVREVAGGTAGEASDD